MDQLVSMVTQKTGISADQAKTAVQTVIGFLKDKLPAPVASQIDGAMGGSSGGGMPNLGNLEKDLGGLGGMMGGGQKQS